MKPATTRSHFALPASKSIAPQSPAPTHLPAAPSAPLALTLTALLALAACSPSSGPSANAENLPPLEAPILIVQPDPATSAEDAPGTVRPVESAILASKVSGIITQMDADPGRIVKAGDLIAQIDDREIRARLDTARAALQQAERDFARFQKLLTDRVITPQEFEAAETRLRTARAAEEEARTLLAYTSVTAPFDGVITQRFAQRGDLAVPGRPLAEVENPGRLRLEAQVPESLVPGLAIGQTIPVLVDAARARLTGTIAEIAPASDPASRTTLVKIDLPETPGLRSGQFGRARIPTPAEPTLRIPASALISRGQLDFVFVATPEQRAALRIVRTGRRDDAHVEILAGLDPGEAILAIASPDVLHGRPIKPTPATPPSPQAPGTPAAPSSQPPAPPQPPSQG